MPLKYESIINIFQGFQWLSLTSGWINSTCHQTSLCETPFGRQKPPKTHCDIKLQWAVFRRCCRRQLEDDIFSHVLREKQQNWLGKNVSKRSVMKRADPGDGLLISWLVVKTPGNESLNSWTLENKAKHNQMTRFQIRETSGMTVSSWRWWWDVWHAFSRPIRGRSRRLYTISTKFTVIKKNIFNLHFLVQHSTFFVFFPLVPETGIEFLKVLTIRSTTWVLARVESALGSAGLNEYDRKHPRWRTDVCTY